MAIMDYNEIEGPAIPSGDARTKFTSSLIEAVPLGTSYVAIGMVVTGIAAYGFISLTAHILGPARYTSISSLWAAIFVVGPGIFLPLQQVINHQFAYRKVHQLGAGPVAYRAASIGGLMVLFLLICTSVGAPELKKYLFDGSTELVVGFALALIGYSMLYVVSGILTGSGRFGYYAIGQSLDGLLRIAVCIILAIVGVKTVGPYGIVFGAVPVVVALAVLVPNRHLLKAGPPVDKKVMSTSLSWLIVGSVGAQLLLNASIISFKVLSNHANQTQVGSFIAGVVIARIPLFLFSAIQTTLLPRLSLLSHAGEFRRLNRDILHITALVATIGVVCTLGIAALGPWVLKVFFGHHFLLGRSTMTILAGTISLYMLAMVANQGLIARGKSAYSAAGWVLGLTVFVAILFTHISLMTRIELAYLVGTITSLITEFGLYWFMHNTTLRQNKSTIQHEIGGSAN